MTKEINWLKEINWPQQETVASNNYEEESKLIAEGTTQILSKNKTSRRNSL